MSAGQMLPWQMSLWQFFHVKDYVGKIPIKYRQNQLSNRKIADIDHGKLGQISRRQVSPEPLLKMFQET